MFDYTITLDDGTEIKANLNANTWEVDKIDVSLFENNTDKVKYTTPEGDIIELGEVVFEYGGVFKERNVHYFVLRPLTAEEKLNKQIIELQVALAEMMEV